MEDKYLVEHITRRHSLLY